MHIIVADGVVGTGVTRHIQSIQHQELPTGVTVAPGFIPNHVFKYPYNIPYYIPGYVQRFRDLVAKTSEQSSRALLTDGSPATLLALAKLYGISLPDSLSESVAHSVRNTGHTVSLVLALPGKSFIPPLSMRKMDPSRLGEYALCLEKTYIEIGIKPEIYRVDSVEQSRPWNYVQA